MITLIEALNFRCFKYIRQPLGPFHVLVGPNASGKSTFFDALSFLFDFVNHDLDTAIHKSAKNFYDLTWNRSETFFELALEIELPEHLCSEDYNAARYELRILMDEEKNEIVIDAENIFWIKSDTVSFIEDEKETVPKTIVSHDLQKKPFRIIRPVVYDGEPNELNYESAVLELPNRSGTSEFPKDFKLSALKIFETRVLDREFSWLKSFFYGGVHKYDLDNSLLGNISEPGTGAYLKMNGSNLPWIIEDFQKKHPDIFEEWIHHLQTALLDLVSLRSVLRPEDHTRYIMLKYSNGVEIPSWLISEGTLRLIALTLVVYIPNNKGVYLFEEPENGIHPQAIETIMQSLQSIYDGQVFITTHSPLILNMVKLDQILCFTKDENGVQIVNGKDHRMLKNWKGNINLGTLFASGVMG